jgi:hypothetical protein
MSGTCEVYRLPPAVGPFLTIETLHGGTLPSVFAVMYMESPFATRAETPSLAQIADTLVECVADDDLLDQALSPLDRSCGRRTRWSNLQLAGAKEEATAPGSGGRWRVRLFARRVRSSKAGSQNWSVYAQPCRSQITNKCLLSLFVDVCARRVNHTRAHICTHMVARVGAGSPHSLRGAHSAGRSARTQCTSVPSGIDFDGAAASWWVQFCVPLFRALWSR